MAALRLGTDAAAVGAVPAAAAGLQPDGSGTPAPRLYSEFRPEPDVQRELDAAAVAEASARGCAPALEPSRGTAPAVQGARVSQATHCMLAVVRRLLLFLQHLSEQGFEVLPTSMFEVGARVGVRLRLSWDSGMA